MMRLVKYEDTSRLTGIYSHIVINLPIQLELKASL